MTNIILSYDNAADVGTLSAGSWSLPLANMQDPRPTKKARSTNLNTTSTTFKIALTSAKTFRAMAFGPTNFSGGGTYRIRCYSDAAYSNLVVDTGTINIGSPPVTTLSLHWTDSNWWSGAVAIDDPDHSGTWAIHVYDTDVTAQFWLFDMDDQANPDGYLEIGRLFMGMSYIPSLNFVPAGNKFGFESNTSVEKAIGGARYYNRRRAARTFQFSLPPPLPQDEVHDDVMRIAQVAGLDQQIFIITQPDDTTRRSKLSFLANLAVLPDWALDNWGGGSAATGFQLTEAL